WFTSSPWCGTIVVVLRIGGRRGRRSRAPSSHARRRVITVAVTFRLSARRRRLVVARRPAHFCLRGRIFVTWRGIVVIRRGGGSRRRLRLPRHRFRPVHGLGRRKLRRQPP